MANTPGNQAQSMFNAKGAAGYDRDAIYASSTDTNGHYEQVRVKVTPSMEAEIAALVASKVRPDYRTVEDFIRSAIVHQMYYEATNQWPPAGTVVTSDIIASDINRLQAKIQSWDMVVRSIADTGETLLNRGALSELGDMLTKYDQDFTKWDLPDEKMKEAQEILDTLHDKLRRAVHKSQ